MNDTNLAMIQRTLIIAEPDSLAPHEEAAKLVTGARNESYDHPFDNFQRTAHIWNGLLYGKLGEGQEITAEDVALMMLGVKMAREAYRHKDDNLVDAHGYLMPLQMVLDRRAEEDQA